MPYTKIDVARSIRSGLEALLQARDRSGHQRFTDADEKWGANGETGLLASLQGIRATFLVLTALADDRHVNIWEPLERNGRMESLLEEWKSALETIRAEGYHAAPYDPGNDLRRLLTVERKLLPYTDAVCWALSAGTLVNHVLKLYREQGKATVPKGLVEATRTQILDCLDTLLDAQCSDGGWSWGARAASGHLFFTSSAIDSLADFADYVLGESEDSIGVGPDRDTIKHLESQRPGVLEQVAAARGRATKHLADRYLPRALAGDLKPEDIADEGVSVQLTDPLVMVYFELYLLEGLILSSYEISDGAQAPDRVKQLEIVYRNIARKFPALRTPEFAKDPERSTLRLEIRSRPKSGRMPDPWVVQDPGLWPQLLRALVLFRFYVQRDPIPDRDVLGEENSALRFLLDDQRPREGDWPGVWDTTAFNLAITARALEGLVDCYDYFDLLQKAQPAATRPALDLTNILAEAIFPPLVDRLTAVTNERIDARVREALTTAGGAQQAGKLSPDELSIVARATASVVDLIGDALDHLVRQEPAVTQDEIVQQLLGSRDADILRTQNPQAYRLLKMLSWLIFYVGVRLYATTIQEAVLEQATDRDGVREFRRKSAEDSTGIADRARQVLHVILDYEMDALKLPADERPSYRQIAQQLLRANSGGASRGRTHGIP